MARSKRSILPLEGQRVIVRLEDALWYTGYISKAPVGDGSRKMTVEWDEGGKYTTEDYYKNVFPIDDNDWALSSEGFTWEYVMPYIQAGGFLKHPREEVARAVDAVLAKVASKLKSPVDGFPNVSLYCQVWSDNWGVVDVYFKVSGGSLGRDKFNRAKTTNQMFACYDKNVAAKVEEQLAEYGFDHKARVLGAIEHGWTSDTSEINQIMITSRYYVGNHRVLLPKGTVKVEKM